jgi:arylsulfatase A-like enzyme
VKTHSARWLACILMLAAIPACFLHRRSHVNVLFLVVDSLRSDAMSVSVGAAQTPNMTALANDGISFRSCYAHSSATLPAHAAILTARMPHTSGVINDVQPIDPEVPLLTDRLAERGWQTFAVVSNDDLVPPGANQGLDRGCQTFHALRNERASAQQTSAQLMSFIETSEADAPWFAYADFSDPAASVDVVKGKDVTARVYLDGATIGTARTQDEDTWSVEVDLTPGKHRFELRSDGSFNLRRFDAATDHGRYPPTFDVGGLFAPVSRIVVSVTNDQDKVATCRFEVRIRSVQTLADSRARYKLQVEAVDRAIGDVIESLKASGKYDDTIIVLTGSHGEALGEHGMTGHDVTLYDEVLRVPLVVKLVKDDPRRAQMSRLQFDLVRHIDIAPTVLALLGERALPAAEGLSLLATDPRELVAESHPPEAPGTIVACRDDRYKLVFDAHSNRFEMFDVKGDTLEMDNLFDLQGQFRTQWQADLRALATSGLQTTAAHMGSGPKIDVNADKKSPASAKN